MSSHRRPCLAWAGICLRVRQAVRRRPADSPGPKSMTPTRPVIEKPWLWAATQFLTRTGTTSVMEVDGNDGAHSERPGNPRRPSLIPALTCFCDEPGIYTCPTSAWRSAIKACTSTGGEG